MQIGNHGTAFFESRNIDLETAVKLGAYTASLRPDGKTAPDPNGKVIAFPFFENGARVACKYRGPDKRFWQDEGGRRTFWNSDVLNEPSLRDGSAALLITEGEVDAMTAIDCGHRLTVSVPDGAPKVPDGKNPEDLDPLVPEEDSSGKFAFVYNNRDKLNTIRRFIIAADADGPGRRLAAELVRRIGASRCSFIVYPADDVVDDGVGGKRRCKDINEVRTHFSAARVVEIINAAKPYPVRGIYKLSDYPDEGELETFSVGWEGWQPHIKIYPGEFIIVTGIPSHGKSAWTLELVHNMADIHGWPTAIFSPEMRTVPLIRNAFRRMRLGRKVAASDTAAIVRADDWIERNMVFIDADPAGDGIEEEPFDVAWLLDRALDAVLRWGIRVLLIDPWNELEHAQGRHETQHQYISRVVRELKRFGRKHGVIVIIVAHPNKDVAKDGKLRTVRLYDIDGSATWNNKPDHGVVVERPDPNSTDVNIYIQKVRSQPDTGRPCKMTMTFNPNTARFTPVECGLPL